MLMLCSMSGGRNSDDLDRYVLYDFGRLAYPRGKPAPVKRLIVNICAFGRGDELEP